MTLITSDYDRRYVLAQFSSAGPSSSSSTTIFTPPESIAGDPTPTPPPNRQGPPNTLSVPIPGNVYLIKVRSASASPPLTLALTGGHVILAPSDGSIPDGSVLWKCTERDGWLGFQNPISGRFLGRDKDNLLICAADLQQGWEHWAVRPRENGSFLLQQEHFWALRHVGRGEVNGLQKLRKMVAHEGEAVEVEFHKVGREMLE